jgi:hypothetical protein
MDQALAQAKLEPSPTSKIWEPQRAYEKRLSTALSKDKRKALRPNTLHFDNADDILQLRKVAGARAQQGRRPQPTKVKQKKQERITKLRRFGQQLHHVRGPGLVE